MGVHTHNLHALGSGFFSRTGACTTTELWEMADALRVDTSEAPEHDLHDWLRQRIFADLEKAA